MEILTFKALHAIYSKWRNSPATIQSHTKSEKYILFIPTYCQSSQEESPEA